MFFKTKKNITRIFVTGLVLSLVLSGCGTKSASTDSQKTENGDKIKIGLAGPFTGAIAETGGTIKKAVELATEQVNEAGGINGKQVELIEADDKADPKESASIANKFVADPTVLGVLANYTSSCTLAAAPVYNRVGLSHIAYGSTSPAVTAAGPFTYRDITTDAYDGEFVAQWTIDEGYKKIAILYENDDYGKGLADVYNKKITELGAKAVMQEPYNLGETKDFSAILTKLKNAGPDALFIAGQYNEAAMIVKQGKRLGITLPVFGSNGLYSDALIQLGGAEAEGIRVIGAFHSTADYPEAKAFIDSYKTKWGQEPDIWAAFAYDAANIMFTAVKNAGEDRKKINDWLTTLKDFKGATGITTFDQNGDCLKQPLKLIIKNGKFEIYNK
ncbi:ABC transporter substrate-binding protein [Desulfosporosinus sp.]|uniref:ABC transporter substrate-binding protein n=1 Tax=Desulfosporosinus sp. TaxID=157907 RepID=UPI000E7EF226|nr:ABC transporter substrate-binding protein [Desulfosporosinus sp.]MBC2723928.1 ABC transporter substrate-binding protein [Desulfosporosinus sp.]MBC2725211.1 ABC transporter substrate-binding protein [Desulfosporosinus sp.]HBV88755.1 branched-chain amino acid ABC transporter substrate-binding protein [Desulfosporosinus sp.]